MTVDNPLEFIQKVLDKANLNKDPLEPKSYILSLGTHAYEMLQFYTSIVELESSEETFLFFHKMEMKERLKMMLLLTRHKLPADAPQKSFATATIPLVQKLAEEYVIMTYQTTCVTLGKMDEMSYLDACMDTLGFYVHEEDMERYHELVHKTADLLETAENTEYHSHILHKN